MDRYNLRYMRTTDIPAVIHIDQQSFPLPWSARSYTFEVSQSDHSHMIVLERIERVPPGNPLQAWWQRTLGGPQETRTLLGYGGLWHFSTRGHVSTIASHPKYRGNGFGELVFVAMLRRSIWLGARQVALEVRVSNHTAQALYAKYRFQQRGIKRGYYHDNDEDAYDMILSLEDPRVTRDIETRYRAFRQQLRFLDSYTRGDRPAR